MKKNKNVDKSVDNVEKNTNVNKSVDSVENKENKEKKLDGKIRAFPLNKKDLRKNVTRKELLDVVQQVIDNVNQISGFLMQDLNTLYSTHVFPFQIQLGVIEDLLVDKGIVTKKELHDKYDEKIKVLQEKARQIKENADGSLGVATEEEDKVSTNQKVLQILNNKKKIEDSVEEIKGKMDVLSEKISESESKLSNI